MKTEVTFFRAGESVVFIECNAVFTELLRQIGDTPLSSLVTVVALAPNEQSQNPLMSLGRLFSEPEDGTSMAAKPLDIAELMETVTSEFPRGYRRMPEWEGEPVLRCVSCNWQFHAANHDTYWQTCPSCGRDVRQTTLSSTKFLIDDRFQIYQGSYAKAMELLANHVNDVGDLRA